MAADSEARVEAIIAARTKGRINRSILYGIVFLAVLWSLKTTVVDDTDWERMGSLWQVLASVGEFLKVDWALLPQLWQPALETILVATLGTLLGVITCIPGHLVRRHEHQPVPADHLSDRPPDDDPVAFDP